MAELHVINHLIFETILIPVVFFSTLYYLVAFTSIFSRRPNARYAAIPASQLPTVSVQLPVYNDPVVARCIDHCLKFDYPRDKYKIMVADDSTDPVTRKIIDKYAKKHPDRVKLFRRGTRKGFKAGALNEVLKHTNQDFVVIFDSDFAPKRNFLREIVRPFSTDKRLAIVQSNTKWLNPDKNLVTKFASAALYAYYNCIMPMTSRFGVAFLGGTGGAIRTSALKSMGGWNEASLTEDADLSVKMFERGYKSTYLYNLEVKGEVPVTFTSLVKQQTRWAYGTTRVFLDNWKSILFSPKFNPIQRAFLIFVTLGYLASPFILVMILTGNLGWFITPPHPVSFAEVVDFARNILITSGFFFLMGLGLYREGRMSTLPQTFASALTVGIGLTATNFAAFMRAVSGRGLTWVRTPKAGSNPIYAMFKKIFKM